MKELIRKLAERLALWLIPRSKRVVISDRHSNDIYLIRYILLKTNWFSIYIHRFMRSDHDVWHDHPWNFFTYIITKGYKESTITPDAKIRGLMRETTGVRLPGSLAYRKATATHKVILHDGPYFEHQEPEAPLTVCLIFKRHRIWGFVKPYHHASTQNVIGHTWVNWLDYLGIKPGDREYEGSE